MSKCLGWRERPPAVALPGVSARAGLPLSPARDYPCASDEAPDHRRGGHARQRRAGGGKRRGPRVGRAVARGARHQRSRRASPPRSPPRSPTRSSTVPPTPMSTVPRRILMRPARSTRPARACSPRPQRQPAPGSSTSRPTTSSTGPRPHRTWSPIRPVRVPSTGRPSCWASGPSRWPRPDRHTVVRSSWLFGTGGSSFPATMLRLAAERDTLDRRRRPARLSDLHGPPGACAGATSPPPQSLPGVVHVAASGECTWYEFAVEIMRATNTHDRGPARSPRISFRVRPAARPTACCALSVPTRRPCRTGATA